MLTARNDVETARLGEFEKFACSARMKAEMQAIAEARGITRSQAWREAGAAYIAAQGEGE